MGRGRAGWLVLLAAVAAVLAAAAQADPPAQPGDPASPDASAQGQARGSRPRDDTAALQRQLDRGGTVTLNALAGGACYRSRGLWVTRDGTTITSPDGACVQYLGQSSDARLQSGDGDPIYANAVFFVNRGSMSSTAPQNVRISNLRLVVPDGTADAQGVNYGIYVAGTGVTVDNVAIDGAPLDAIQVSGRGNGTSCSCASQVTVSNSRISAARRNGVTVVSAIGMTLESNTIEGAGNPAFLGGATATGPAAGIDVEPDLTFYPVKQLTIHGNTVSQSGGAGVLFALDLNGSYPTVADAIALDANTISGNGAAGGSFLHGGVCLQGGEADGNGHLSVTGNQITNNTGYGLCTTGYRMQVTISGNTISGNTQGNDSTFQSV